MHKLGSKLSNTLAVLSLQADSIDKPTAEDKEPLGW